MGSSHNLGNHRRHSIRLKDYDYSQPGAYFVTIAINRQECLLGEIVDGTMRLNALGLVVEECWNELPRHYNQIELDAFIVMPNHVHGIIIITVGAGLKPAPTKRHGLMEIIRAFKTFSARRINEHRSTPGTPLWQRNYYKHVIRNEDELNRIRQYIQNNPAQWALDWENPSAPCRGAACCAPAKMVCE